MMLPLPEMNDDEEAMLSSFYVKSNSRLGCQIQSPKN
jgi:2Fe-2S ferredoxin